MKQNDTSVRGLPPEPLIEAGVACVNPIWMQRQGINLLDILHIQLKNHIGDDRANDSDADALDVCSSFVTAASIWPLAAVPDGYVALDDGSLKSLRIEAADLQTDILRSSTPRKKSSAKKKAKQKARAGARERERDDGTHTPRSTPRRPRTSQTYTTPPPNHATPDRNAVATPLVNVTLTCLGAGLSIPEARSVVLSPTREIEVMGCESVELMIRAIMNGRFVVCGVCVHVTVLGRDETLDVVSVDDASETNLDSVKRFTVNSRVHVFPRGFIEERKNRDVGVAGLDCVVKELEALAKRAFPLGGEDDRESENLSARIPRGVLLFGPPGTGKTLLATSLSAKLNTNLEFICAPEILALSSSEAIRRVEEIFDRARRRKPCVVVLDEVDILTPRRDAPDIQNVQRKTTAALLAILDGHDTDLRGIVVIGTTNRAEALDPAMRRAGRFDREIELPIPDSNARFEILHMLTQTARQSGRLGIADEDMRSFARLCYGYVGADLHSLWRETARLALTRGSNSTIETEDFHLALRTTRPTALREIAVDIPTTKWSDIGGMAEAKKRLQEAVEWPLSPEGARLFASFSIQPPRGILLFGPPGCSKTLLARAVACESRANFISVKGAELLSKWVGESEKAVRSIFRRARQSAPCVIFFDEIDALATSRSFISGGAQKRVVAQLLAEMDGIETSRTSENRVVVIAATNRPDTLDEAFLRPGRIDVQIYVGLPDSDGRLAILNVHTRHMPLAQDVRVDELAEETEGYTGAEVAAVVREAGLVAMERDVECADLVTMSDLEEALGRVGPRTPREVVEYFDKYVGALQGRGGRNLVLGSISKKI